MWIRKVVEEISILGNCRGLCGPWVNPLDYLKPFGGTGNLGHNATTEMSATLIK